MRNQQNRKGIQEEGVSNRGSKRSLSSDPEHKRTRKPGSQSNSSKQSNNGRGGGK